LAILLRLLILAILLMLFDFLAPTDFKINVMENQRDKQE
jgi:hypothetical protein